MNTVEVAWKQWLDKQWRWLLIIGIIVNALGLLSPILEPDGALYATLSKNLMLSGDYLNLKLHGNDWLDKPHFQFWITALSFKIFGTTTFAYKFPALLFWLVGLLYTFRFARQFYSMSVAQLATLIYVTAFHLVLSNNDVRAEPYLTGLIIASLYHCHLGIDRQKRKDILLGALFAAAAIMTKGIFAGIIIFSGLILNWLWQKQWNKNIFIYATLTLLLTLLLISPEIISLYLQFDLHPEKIVFGQTHVSGIRFFFWDSQFGRFFNTGPIRGEGDPTFFLHTTLWAFFPWSLIFFASVYKKLRNILTDQGEKISLMVILITFLLFSFSKFQLPHYLNIIFPLMAIQSAQFLYSIDIRHHKIWADIFIFVGLLSFASVVFLAHYSLPEYATPVSILSVVLATVFFFMRNRSLQLWTGYALIGSVFLYLFLNLMLVPVLLRYQSGLEAAGYLKNNFSPTPAVVMLNQDLSFSFDFYYPQEVAHLTLEKLAGMKERPLLFCNEDALPSLEQRGMHFEIIKSFAHYHVSQPSEELLNATTREKSAHHYLIIKLR